MSGTNAVRMRDRLPGEASTRERPAGLLRLPERINAFADRIRSLGTGRQAEALRATVREGREFVRGWGPDAVSRDTAERYTARAAFMQAHGLRPEDAACRNSFMFDRAALVHTARAEVKAGLRDLDRARRSGDIDGGARAVLAVQRATGVLRAYPPGTGRAEEDMKRISAFSGPRDAGMSKRGSARALPPDWRERVQAELNVYDAAPGAVMSLTGARPAEINGIRVRADGERIAITIRGAKTDERRGVESRVLAYDRAQLAGSVHGRAILDFLGEREQRTVAVHGSEAAFRQRFQRAAERAGLTDTSAYTARHAQRRELSEQGASKREIAERLGHRNERSQRAYG